jgi:hypothetical protein
MAVANWCDQSVFVEASIPLPLPLDRAKVALQRAIANGGLVDESHRAFAEGMAVLRSVGPRGVAKQVRVTLLACRELDGTTIVPLHWEATGPAGHIFPVLNANLCLRSADPVTTVLLVIGQYSPPLGRFGEMLDRVVMGGAGRATAKALVRELASVVRRDASTAVAPSPREVSQR